ncbi:FeoC-like transcriptional regulator [Photobacterium sp. MCCC 1A19761]|uniref:FeoC-like transcriptional regulator n=1 Tax=Photobacterium sp. MCCC 1A19761 TaxID=3115000 RepID=UPI00307CD818
MILQQLRQFLEPRGKTSRTVLAQHFGLSEDGVDAMLEIWVKKGKLSRELSGCEGMPCCREAAGVWYRWLSARELAITVLH